MSAGPVVPEARALDERAFHERVTAGWSRCIPLAGGIEPFALAVGMGVRGVRKVLAGTTPHACTLINSRRAHPSALDELLAGYGVRLVPEGAVASSDAGAGLPLLKAATACVEAEADAVIDHRELLAMEPELREAAAHLGALLARIDRLRSD